MRRLALMAAALLASGCPTLGDSLPVVPLGDGGDMTSGPDAEPPPIPDRGRPDSRRDMQPPPDLALPDLTLPDLALPDHGAPDAEPVEPPCELPDLPCVACTDDGQLVAPEDDDTCPELDCDVYTLYESEFDGEAVRCFGHYRFPSGGRCLDVGRCYDDEYDYCDEPFTLLEAEVAPGPCAALLGCEDEIPPEVVRADVGSPCNDIGTCTADGACTANPACDGFVLPGNSFFCAARDGPGPYCEFYLEAPMAIDCAGFCGQHGWRCDAAWNSMVGMCAHEPVQAGCGQPFDSFVCRCAPD